MKVTMPSASDVLQFRYFTSTPLWLIPPLLLFSHWDAPVNLKFGRFSPCLQSFVVNVATLMLSTVLLNRTLKLACDRVGYICFLKSICCNNMVHTTLQHFASYSSFFGWAGGPIEGCTAIIPAPTPCLHLHPLGYTPPLCNIVEENIFIPPEPCVLPTLAVPDHSLYLS